MKIVREGKREERREKEGRKWKGCGGERRKKEEGCGGVLRGEM